MPEEVKRKFTEIGATGLRRWGGYVDEEFLHQLKGPRAVRIYKEMRENDPVVGAVIFAVDMLLRQISWRTEPYSQDWMDLQAEELVKTSMDDMCYDNQTEVLTRRGWVFFADLDDSDEVAQRTDDGFMEWVTPKARHVYDFDGELLGNAGDAVDFLVSPNHRMLFAPRTGRKHDASQKHDLAIHKAKDIFNKSGWVSKQVRWEGQPTGLTKDELEFLGFCLADGNVSGRAVVLIQQETAYVEDLLLRCGLKAKTRQVNGSTQWTIHDAAWARSLVEDFGRTSRIKKIPSWLKEAPPEELECFLRGFDEGDGYHSPTGLIALYTSSQHLADDLMEIGMKAGYATTLLTREGSPSSFAPGAANYRVSLWSQDAALHPYLKTGRNWYRQPYKGQIYCVSVPSGVIMVRRNGKPMWSGNSHTWEDLVSEILSMLIYGWSWHEVVYKRRVGDVRNPKFRSKHNDGLIGWRKMPIRAQETLFEWKFDDDGGVQAMDQIAPPDYQKHRIPIGKSLLFRTSIHKNNPEGRSILRSSYRPWYFKKRLEEVEGIGIERDLAGLPVAWVPAEILSPDADDNDKAIAEMFKQMVRNVRRDEQEGLVLPMEFDQDTGNQLYEFELLNSGGTRAINIDTAIQRYEQRIAMTILADFILIGHEQTGSYALSVNKTGIFRTALNSWAESIAEVFNRHEIPRLFDLNGWKLEGYPKIVPSEVDPPDLGELGQFITQLAGAGMPLFPDPDLEDFFRDIAKMPEQSEEAKMMQEMMMQQQAAMGPPDEDFDDDDFEDEEMFS